jgi:hypothetical protein
MNGGFPEGPFGASGVRSWPVGAFRAPGWNGISSCPHFATLVSNLQLLAKITYRRYTHRELRCKCYIGEWILDWEIVAIILLGGAAMGGLAYLLGEYRSLRDRDWT